MFNKNILLSAAGRNEEEKTPFTLYAWGDNQYGKIGDGQKTYNYTSPVITTLNPQLSPTLVGGAGGTWSKISTGWASSYAIKSNGTLWAWGDNRSGQLGTGNRVNTSSPVQIGALTNWSAVSGSSDEANNITYPFAIALKTDGTLWAWGQNTDGQLGTGNRVGTSSPVQIGLDTNWSSKISAGGYYYDACAFAIKSNGTLWAWGNNGSGQLGTGDRVNRSSPVQIGLDTNWSAIEAGGSVLAVKTDGTLWAWGDNGSGQLGTGNRVNTSSPVQIGLDTNWSKISNNGDSSYAIKSNGTLWAWGDNGSGQLGTGNRVNTSSPVQIGALTNWSNVTSNTNLYSGSLNTAFCVATKTDGTLWAWGGNWDGQLGTYGGDSRSSPVQVGVLTGWGAISAGGGDGHVLAIRSGTDLYSWGDNSYGQLGYATNGVSNVTITSYANRSSPVQIGSPLEWVEASYSGSSHSLAVKADATLWAWGLNTNGQLGIGDKVSRSSPIQIGSLANWSRVSTGDSFSVAVKTTGTLWTWGYNADGQLGTGDLTSRSSPVQIGSLANWKYVSAGRRATAAIKTNGTLWMWGHNLGYQLGLGNAVNRNSPTQVGTLSNWKYVSTGDNSTLAVKTDGTLWAWGTNENGELGLSNLTTIASPVQVGSLNNWSNVSISSVNTGNDHVLAIKTDGTLWAWGSNGEGQLGTDNRITRSSPVQVGSDTNWSYAVAGGFHSIAIKTDGTLWAWGRNDEGQLGIGNSVSRSSPVQVGTLTNWIVNTAGVITSAGGTS